ncbi:lipid transferase CIDEB-like [Pogoniulus pusillus]|uniref:lipid transferase CIDEB-like n=1 Tax=Pogoniulus pusillus TaxID=488313 RepID=UPI0030B96258
MQTLRAITNWAWPSQAPRPKPLWVCDKRGRQRGLLVTGLEELRRQAAEALSLPPELSLVLPRDGSSVASQGVLELLPPHSLLLALEPGQSWEPPKPQLLQELEVPRQRRAQDGTEVAQVTLALTKSSPEELLGQLRVTASVRSLRWDVAGLGPERLLRDLLRLLAALTRGVGQSLLGLSAALRHLLDAATPQRVTNQH